MSWEYWLILAVLLLMSAFFSAADMAYGSVDRNRLVKKAETSKLAAIALKLVDRYEFSISSILFGNNLVNILASSIITIVGTSAYGDMGASIGAIIFTVILIIFAEFLPKAIAKRFNYTLSLAFAYPVFFFSALFFVFVWPISKMFQLIGKLFTKKAKEEEEIGEEELDEMIDEIEESGELEKDEAELVRGAVDLIDIEAYEIMTPRVDVFAVDVDENIKEKYEISELLKHSRIPVYENTIDNIIGIIPVKTLARLLLSGGEIDVRSLLYRPLYIPRNYQIVKLLDDFRKDRIHIAIVKDEYGGTDGIVTMEDIIEEIVGDIFDETDEVVEEVKKVRKGIYLISGMMNIDDFFELIDYHDDFDTNYSTVGGLCQEFFEDFPNVGDSFHIGNYKITITKADRYSVIQVKACRVYKKTN
ncbi:MAG: HlyC/CorC family transporter [Erysipelotrichaceae bacterium]|nr:HlyC/CorC family transporter [Erysipelotrichaceae bacterium]